jgi:hypothetical protein
MKTKTVEIADLKRKNKQLADELSELQNIVNGKGGKVDESEKCLKLTKVVSNKSKEITDLKTENTSLKEKNQDMIKKLNEMSTTVTGLEVKNTRLESQVENLIEAVGKNDTKSRKNEPIVTNKPRSRDEEDMSPKPMTKCRHNDKAICLRKDSCQFLHNKIVCNAYSKYGTCENEERCMKRHPHGICNRWKKGVCDKENECFYRHPAGEEGSESRKRTLSNQQMYQNNKSQKIVEETQKNQDNHFLVQKVLDLEKKYKCLEEKKLEKKEENIPAGWINTRWSAATTPVPSFMTQSANPVPSFQTQPSNQVPPYQTPFAPATPSGSQWIQQQQQPQQIYQFPGIQQYHH